MKLLARRPFVTENSCCSYCCWWWWWWRCIPSVTCRSSFIVPMALRHAQQHVHLVICLTMFSACHSLEPCLMIYRFKCHVLLYNSAHVLSNLSSVFDVRIMRVLVSCAYKPICLLTLVIFHAIDSSTRSVSCVYELMTHTWSKLKRSCNQFIDRCFATAESTLWNSLPEQLRRGNRTSPPDSSNDR